MLEQLKTILGLTDNSKDTLLTLLYNEAVEEAIAFTHNEDCIPMIQSTLIKMTVVLYNRLGTEGLESESYSGVSYNYSSDFPEAIMRVLRAHRKVRVV